MKFRKQRFLSSSVALSLVVTIPISFVATGQGKVVFEVEVGGKSVVQTQKYGDSWTRVMAQFQITP